jgi:ubiquitin carboxyl-terminal hydrolase 48
MKSGESQDCLPESSSSSLKQPSSEAQSNPISTADTSDAFLVQEIVCEHGYLDPSKAADMKCINNVSSFCCPLFVLDELIFQTAREKILSYGCEIVPLLTTEDVCRTCVTRTFEGTGATFMSMFLPADLSLKLDKLYQINHPLLVANFDEACEVEGRNGFWISKPWLKGKAI